MSIVPATQAHPAAPAPRKQGAPPRITKQIAEAINFMVYEGLTFDQAALKANLTVRAMRLALERPHVLRHLREQKHVFRASVSAANISALVKIRDESGNAMAQLGAIKTLEQLDEEHQAGGSAKSLPGLQIVVITGQPQQPPMIDVSSRSAGDD